MLISVQHETCIQYMGTIYYIIHIHTQYSKLQHLFTFFRVLFPHLIYPYINTAKFILCVACVSVFCLAAIRWLFFCLFFFIAVFVFKKIFLYFVSLFHAFTPSLSLFLSHLLCYDSVLACQCACFNRSGEFSVFFSATYTYCITLFFLV